MSRTVGPRSFPAAAAVALSVALALPASGLATSHLMAHATAGRTPWTSAFAAPRLPAGAHVVGNLAEGTAMTVGVMLAPRDARALATFVADVSNPASPLFGRYLRRGQFAARFGPTDATVRRVERFFAGVGLSHVTLSSNRLMLELRGSAAQFERAFGVGLLRCASATAASELPRLRLGLPAGSSDTSTRSSGSTTSRPRTRSAPASSGSIVRRADSVPWVPLPGERDGGALCVRRRDHRRRAERWDHRWRGLPCLRGRRPLRKWRSRRGRDDRALRARAIRDVGHRGVRQLLLRQESLP